MPSSPLYSHYDRCNNCRRSSNIRYTREPQQQLGHQKQQEKQRQLSSLSYDDKIMECVAPVRKLNNLSAMFIEIGEYDKAIASLGKALKLSKEIQTDCSIDACIHHNEHEYSMDIVDDEPTFYQRPIRIPKRPIREGHNMGLNLFLVITFNLALTHHLRALKKTNLLSSTNTSSMLNRSVQLYELAINLQHPQSDYVTVDDDSEEDDEDNTIISIEEVNTYSSKFNTILYNNLNHLNRLIMRNNDASRTRSSSTEVCTHVLSTNNDGVESIKTNLAEEDCHQQTQQSLSCEVDDDDDDLEFEYCNTNDENVYSLQNRRQEELVHRHHCYSSKASLKQNQWLDDVVVERSRYNSRVRTSSSPPSYILLQ